MDVAEMKFKKWVIFVIRKGKIRNQNTKESVTVQQLIRKVYRNVGNERLDAKGEEVETT